MPKKIIVVILFIGLIFTSGCIGFLTGEGPLRLQADSAGVQDTALDQTGFEEKSINNSTIERTVNVSGKNRTVFLQTKTATYVEEKEVLGGSYEIAVFSVVSIPSIPGGSFLTYIPDSLIIENVGKYAIPVDELEEHTTYKENILGQNTTVTEFRGKASGPAGQDIEISVHTTKLVHDGDIIVIVAVHPTKMEEYDNDLPTLYKNVVHTDTSENESPFWKVWE